MRKQLYPILFGGFRLRNYLQSVGGSYYDSTNLSTLYQDSAGTTPVGTIGDPIGLVVDTINSKNGTQSTSVQRPTFQTTGVKFDGSDDNLLTSYLAGVGNNFIVALATVPATLASFQYIAGSADASNNRFSIGINTDGTLGIGAGTTSPITQKGTTDLRGTDAVIGWSSNGSALRGFVNGAVEGPSSITGSINTAWPIRLGCNNQTGAAATFFSGSIKRLVVGKDFLTLQRFQQIRSALLAA